MWNPSSIKPSSPGRGTYIALRCAFLSTKSARRIISRSPVLRRMQGSKAGHGLCCYGHKSSIAVWRRYLCPRLVGYLSLDSISKNVANSVISSSKEVPSHSSARHESYQEQVSTRSPFLSCQCHQSMITSSTLIIVFNNFFRRLSLEVSTIVSSSSFVLLFVTLLLEQPVCIIICHPPKTVILSHEFITLPRHFRWRWTARRSLVALVTSKWMPPSNGGKSRR